MPDDSLKRHLRSQIIQAGGPGMMSAVARHRGFPSAQAMETALALGSKLAHGGAVTQQDVQNLARLYPAVPQSALYGYAQRINSAEPGTARRDALVRNFGFGSALAEAAQEIDSYTAHDYARAINAKRAERDTAPTAEERAHPVARHNADAASRRALIEQQMGEPPEFKPNSGYSSTLSQLADRMDERAERYDLAEINAVANGRERSRSDDIAHAIDYHHDMAQADALMGSADLIEPYAEATSGENHE